VAHFTCFANAKVQILTRSPRGLTGTCQFTCFTGAQVQTLTQRTYVQA
jgi:hypothetical protein